MLLLCFRRRSIPLPSFVVLQNVTSSQYTVSFTSHPQTQGIRRTDPMCFSLRRMPNNEPGENEFQHQTNISVNQKRVKKKDSAKKKKAPVLRQIAEPFAPFPPSLISMIFWSVDFFPCAIQVYAYSPNVCDMPARLSEKKKREGVKDKRVACRRFVEISTRLKPRRWPGRRGQKPGATRHGPNRQGRQEG